MIIKINCKNLNSQAFEIILDKVTLMIKELCLENSVKIEVSKNE